MKPVAESEAVVRQVAGETGVDEKTVALYIRAFRAEIDGLLGQDFSIIADPLILAPMDDPVFRRFQERSRTATDQELDDFYSGDIDAIVRFLDLERELVLRFPPATAADILHYAVRRLKITGEINDESPVLRVFRAWRQTFVNRRKYHIGGVGLEADMEAWLANNLHVLKPFGYDVALGSSPQTPVSLQWIFKDGRRSDIICRFISADTYARVGDLLVIELKVTSGSMKAVDQLLGYVMRAEAEIAAPEQEVSGLLIADGAAHGVQEYAKEQGIGYLPLTSLGYRDAVDG